MSRQRLLLVIDSLNRFGATRQLDLLTQELSSDFDIHIAVLDVEAETPSGLISNDDARSFHFLAANRPSNTLRSLTRSGLRLRKLIRRLKPDILHAWCHPAERVALSAATEFKTLTRFVTELYLRPSSRLIAKAFDLRLSESVERYVVSHEEVKKDLIDHGYPERQISIVPGTIGSVSPNREIARRKLVQIGGFGGHIHIAGAVAPLTPRTRLKDIIWATDLLTCIRDDVHFFIFGSGSQRKRLEKFASQTEAGHHIHFIDSEFAALDLIPGLDFFWQSHLNEPLPSALCHAMLSGVPVVSVYGPGTTELIQHQETGFATNVGARDEFARWTKFLLEQSEQGKQLADQGRASLEGKFPVSEMAAAYRDLYQS